MSHSQWKATKHLKSFVRILRVVVADLFLSCSFPLVHLLICLISLQIYPTMCWVGSFLIIFTSDKKQAPSCYHYRLAARPCCMLSQAGEFVRSAGLSVKVLRMAQFLF